MLALMEAGVAPPDLLVGCSVGALNGATFAGYPSVAGVEMLRQVWLSKLARDVFHAHPVGVVLSRLQGRRLSVLPAANLARLIDRIGAMTGFAAFEQLRLPLSVVATDFSAGRREVFRSGPLRPALLASTAIPGIFPAVAIEGRLYLDGGIVDNTPMDVAVEAGAREVLAISLMAEGELEGRPRSWGMLMARTLQLSLHHQMLSEFERLRERARLTVICPVSTPTEGWDMRREHLEAVIETARAATAGLLAKRGSRLFRRSEVHYLPL
jgi:NTE family protein